MRPSLFVIAALIPLICSGKVLAGNLREHGNSYPSYRTHRSATSGMMFAKPDECAERDEPAAKAKGRTCQRKCISDSDCVNDRKLCLCDGICGLSCIRPEKECPELPDPPHGQVHLTGRYFNDRAAYTCDEGYIIVGLEQVLCNSDGQWSGSQPSCKQAAANSQSRYYCGEPTRIPNARHNGSKEQLFYDLDTELTYTCLTGYKRKGFQEAQCFFYNDSARWFGPDLQCNPIDCGTPEDIINGKRKGDCTTYQCQIHYECVPGFELVGKDIRYCQSDGTWTPSELPACVPVQCPVPDRPINGEAMFTAVAYKSVASYKCKYGFMIVGEATRTCGEDKKWTGDDPECKEINCGNPGFLPNGWLEGSKNTLHSVITYRCIDGMKFEGNSFRTTCQDNGKWSHPLPKCLAPCIVPNIAKGRVANLTVGSTIAHGDHIDVVCAEKFELAANSSPISCNNGTWSSIPRCEPARCKSLPTPPLNGMVVVPRTKHGGVGLYQCKDGFILKGQNTTSCDFGNWTGHTPICELIYCPFPGYIENGKVLLVGNMGLYDYRPYVRKVKNNRQIVFECGRGSVLEDGPPGATCIDGKWSPDSLPRCVDRFHPKMVQWKRKKRSISTYPIKIQRALRRNSREEYTRNRGRRAARNSNKCPEIIDTNMSMKVIRTVTIEEGSTNVSYNNNHHLGISRNAKGSVLKLSCATGYELNIPKKKVRCKKGSWRPAHPSCVPVKCKLPKLEDGGRYMLDNVVLPGEGLIEHGKDVSLECDLGYFLSGPERQRCWHGSWTGNFDMPKCVGNPCKLVPIPGGGKYIGNGGNFQPGQLIPHKAEIDFECDEVKNVLQPLKCERGQLMPEPPECFVASNVNNVEKRKSNPWLGSYEYSASPSLIQDGDIRGILLSNLPPEKDMGTTAVRLIQDKRSCPPPDEVEGSLIYLAQAREALDFSHSIEYPHGTEVRFECVELGNAATPEETEEDNGKEEPRLQSWKVICEDGKWVGRAYACFNSNDENAHSGFNASCFFSPRERIANNVASFHGDREITYDENFPAGTELLFRCNDIGKFVMNGTKRQRCIGGEWDGMAPTCSGLNQMYNYSKDKPPTILIRHSNGQIAQTNDGRLLVTPGTILHMECLSKRSYGDPFWEIKTFSTRRYNQEWTSDPGRNSQLEYRLSIYHAKINDTGTYRCSTPEGLWHKIRILVRKVRCPPLKVTEGLVISNVNATKLNDIVHFTCNNNNELIGQSPLKCLPSGNWNHKTPACINVICPDSISRNPPPGLKVEVESFSLGGKVHFSCSEGYKMSGQTTAECGSNGHWKFASGQLPPMCSPIICPTLELSVHGYFKKGSQAKQNEVGSVVEIGCQNGYMMEGNPVLECKEGGVWSHPAPLCTIACTYPGSAVGGRIDLVKFYYGVGERVRYDCLEGKVMHGAKRLECLKSGQWSGPVPICADD